MSRIALGTAQFGMAYGIANINGQVSCAIAKTMLDLARVSGVDTLDTAIAYGDSETALGKAGVADFKVVTKLPPLPESCANIDAWVHEQTASSMERLAISSVYGLLLHQPESLLGPHGKAISNALQHMKDAGKVRKIGVSIYDAIELNSLIPAFQIDIVQAPLNLVDRRLHSSGWLEKLKDKDIEVHTRSTFLQGLLLMPPETLPEKFAPWSSLWDRWRRWITVHGTSTLQTCLAYPLSFPEVDRVVVGADSVAHLQQIISASSTALYAEFPDLACNSRNLIDPRNWNSL